MTCYVTYLETHVVDQDWPSWCGVFSQVELCQMLPELIGKRIVLRYHICNGSYPNGVIQTATIIPSQFLKFIKMVNNNNIIKSLKNGYFCFSYFHSYILSRRCHGVTSGKGSSCVNSVLGFELYFLWSPTVKS